MLKKFFGFLILNLSLTACQLKTHTVKGIEIGGVDGALYANQSIKKNWELQNLIKRVLAKDKTAVKELLNFDCGGGAGCYDLGFIFSEMVYKMGENEFINLTNDLSDDEKATLSGFLDVGLEYGYEPYSTLKTQTTFPKLYNALNKK